MNTFDLDDFVRGRITDTFVMAGARLAQTIDDPDDAAAIPMAMFQAEATLLDAWEQFITEKVKP